MRTMLKWDWVISTAIVAAGGNERPAVIAAADLMKAERVDSEVEREMRWASWTDREVFQQLVLA